MSEIATLAYWRLSLSGTPKTRPTPLFPGSRPRAGGEYGGTRADRSACGGAACFSLRVKARHQLLSEALVGAGPSTSAMARRGRAGAEGEATTDDKRGADADTGRACTAARAGRAPALARSRSRRGRDAQCASRSDEAATAGKQSGALRMTASAHSLPPSEPPSTAKCRADNTTSNTRQPTYPGITRTPASSRSPNSLSRAHRSDGHPMNMRATGSLRRCARACTCVGEKGARRKIRSCG